MKPMIFLNVGWMQKYRGLIGTGDTITSGGAYVQEHSYGHEIFNFKPHDGYMYGYVQVEGSIALERLDASKGDNSIGGVLAIWVARDPQGGTFIVGWYDNATVYRDSQYPPQGSEREYNGEKLFYKVKAKENDCRLLPVDERVFSIPRGVKGGMGRANVWYADQPVNAPFKQKVWEYVTQKRLPSAQKPAAPKEHPRQPDPYKRQRVEHKAIELIVAHYERLGYMVDSVEKDNVGWDLEATLGDRLLRLEVKGLSQKELLTGLTPNEYSSMWEHLDSYRVCVVTDALGEKPILRIFVFSPENEKWEDDDENQLTIDEITGARISVRT
ncbi:MAG TPA: DUF3883 domain-containing protein [Anaerolineae bacterium]|nr:DUF3883 domain-containing protein [Anaerolineae bacterium]